MQEQSRTTTADAILDAISSTPGPWCLVKGWHQNADGRPRYLIRHGERKTGNPPKHCDAACPTAARLTRTNGGALGLHRNLAYAADDEYDHASHGDDRERRHQLRQQLLAATGLREPEEEA